MITRGETTFMVAPKEQAVVANLSGKKDSCRTHLWRVPFYLGPPKKQAVFIFDEYTLPKL